MHSAMPVRVLALTIVLALPVVLAAMFLPASVVAAGALATAGADAPATAGADALATAGADAPVPGRALEVTALIDPPPSNLVPPPIMPGWPQVMPTVPLFSPVGVTLADVDANGDLEVLAGSTDGLFRVWDHDGTLLPGWPQAMGGQVQSKAAAADLDGDGDLEILVAVKSGQLHVRHHDGTSVSGWPRPWGDDLGFLSPSVFDLDRDGRPEVLMGGGGTVNAWRADGTSVPGFPHVVGGLITATLAVGDVIGDSRPEIFATAINPGTLHGLAADGTILPGWPKATGLSSSYAAPSIGDLDGDGTREVLVVGYSFGNFTRIHGYRGDGTDFPNFPITYASLQTYSCPVIGDVDGDGDLELWNGGKVPAAPSYYGWDHLGSVLPGWPRPLDNLEGSTLLANLDAEPEMEIVIADNYDPGLFYGYNVDGSTAPDFPFSKLGAGLPNSPSVADVDQDGDIDFAMTHANGAVAIWDFAVPYDPDAIEWGCLFHDNWHTNLHGFVVPGGTTAVDSAALPPAAILQLGHPFPNPAHASGVTIPFALATGEEARLTIYDVGGRLVRTLAERSFAGGRHTVVWDGRNDGGRIVARGVYRVRLDGAAVSQERKVTLTRN